MSRTKFKLYMIGYDEDTLLGEFDSTLLANRYWHENRYKGEAKIIVEKDGKNVTGWRVY